MRSRRHNQYQKLDETTDYFSAGGQDWFPQSISVDNLSQSVPQKHFRQTRFVFGLWFKKYEIDDKGFASLRYQKKILRPIE